MKMTKLTRAGLIALAALAVPVGATAQQKPAAPAPAPAPQPSAQQQPSAEQQKAQAMFLELQQIQEKLEPIQAKALEDAKLKGAQEALGNEIKGAIEKADPGVTASVERLQALEAEAMQAQQGGDQAKLQQLVQEAQQIQGRFMAAQQKAFAQPALSAKVEAFQTDLEKKMIQVDPQAAPLIQRFKQLGKELETLMQAG
jgi:hypothetical protein